MGINEELAKAFGSHTLWKARIERAAEAGKSEFAPADVCKDHLCTFGKWLKDPNLSQEIKRSSHYVEVNRLHRQFHEAAGAAIGMAVGGDAQGARRDTVSGGYYQAGQRFYEAMFAWQRDVAVTSSNFLTSHLAIRLWAALLLPAALVLTALLAPRGGWVDALLAVGALAAGGIAFLLFRSVTHTLGDLTRVTKALAKGDLFVDIPSMHRSDVLGELARATLVFKEQSVAVERIAGVREKERERTESERRAALLQMAENIEGQTSTAVGRIASDAETMYETSKRMAKGAQEVEINAQIVAAAAEQSLINAQTVSSATDTLSTQISKIAGQMEESIIAVGEAVMAADNAADNVDALSQAMAAIDQVVQLIAEIASQTNLLALNATIEAARAGDAGKGFAVVANEVKNLANQTARQTEEISSRIANLNAMAQKVIGAIKSTAAKVQDVEQIASAVAQAVQEQQRATDEITSNVTQSSKAAREVADRIVVVADEAVNTGRQAGEVETMLRTMTGTVGELGQLLNRTVRTSTPEVNRRENPRYRLEMPVKVAGENGEVQGTVMDISLGGARISGIPGLAAGQRTTLNLEGVSLPAVVIESNDNFCRVKIDEDRRPQVGLLINRHAANS